MKRVNLTVYGRVQKVGCRNAVAELARRLKISGTLRNLEDEVPIGIIAEGEDDAINQFTNVINIHDHTVDVEKMDVKEEEPTNEFKYFKISIGESGEELGGVWMSQVDWYIGC